VSAYLTVHKASELVGVSSDTIRRWDRLGIIKSKRSNKNYRLFSIKGLEIVKSKKNGNSGKYGYRILKEKKKSTYKTIELFTGAGGTALGLENAGLTNTMVVEINKDAVATLKRNRPKWNIIHDDIKNISFKGLEADIIEGGFPCQAFSYAGKGKGFEDTRGTLFFEFARVIKEIKPLIAIGENVRGLVRHDSGKTLETMVNVLKELGYRVSYKVLRSQYLDVPQKRERLILIGVRDDLDIPILFPKETDYIITIKEALKNVPESEGQIYPERKKGIMELIPPGGYWKDLPINIQKDYMGASFYMGGGKTGMARRLAWDEPSLTLTTSPAQKQTERCHPAETRPLKVREYARIQTFPDEWVFEGSIASQYKQIGNAVPPNLGYHIGKAIIEMLDKGYEYDKELFEEHHISYSKQGRLL